MRLFGRACRTNIVLENVDPVALPVLFNNGLIETVLVPEFSGKHIGASTKVQSAGVSANMSCSI